MGKVSKSLLVCATPRSGSTLPCALLEGTGVAGRPQEFFERLAHSGLPRQPRQYFGGSHDAEVLDNRGAAYHRRAIGHLVAQIGEHDDAWRAWFAANRIRPLTIAYEDLAADTEGATRAVLDHLGTGPAPIPAPPERRPLGALGGALPGRGAAAGVTDRTQNRCGRAPGRASSFSWWSVTPGSRSR